MARRLDPEPGNGTKPQEHGMELVRVDDSNGGEHWICFSCGRQILLWWPPRYKRTILVPGDENAYHSACKGGIAAGPMTVKEHPPEARDADETRH